MSGWTVVDKLLPMIEKLIPALTTLIGVYVGTRISSRTQEKLARLGWEQQLRTSALDKRLEKHQEAFSLWWQLYGDLHSERLSETVTQCQEWWRKNCLYLTPEVADQFVATYHNAANHANLVSIWRRTNSHDDDMKLKANFEFIRSLGPKIRSAMQLPNVTVTDEPGGITARGED